MSTPLYVTNNGRRSLAGRVVGDTFKKTVRRNKHYMRVVGGYGIQEPLLRLLKRLGVKHVEIKESDIGATLTSKIEDWDEHSKTADYGAGKQVFLSVNYMTERRR